jgi:hypothetical protein
LLQRGNNTKWKRRLRGHPSLIVEPQKLLAHVILIKWLITTLDSSTIPNTTFFSKIFFNFMQNKLSFPSFNHSFDTTKNNIQWIQEPLSCKWGNQSMCYGSLYFSCVDTSVWCQTNEINLDF